MIHSALPREPTQLTPRPAPPSQGPLLLAPKRTTHTRPWRIWLTPRPPHPPQACPPLAPRSNLRCRPASEDMGDPCPHPTLPRLTPAGPQEHPLTPDLEDMGDPCSPPHPPQAHPVGLRSTHSRPALENMADPCAHPTLPRLTPLAPREHPPQPPRLRSAVEGRRYHTRLTQPLPLGPISAEMGLRAPICQGEFQTPGVEQGELGWKTRHRDVQSGAHNCRAASGDPCHPAASGRCFHITGSYQWGVHEGFPSQSPGVDH